MGKVYLTGAGPGDIDLLTVKALRLIQQADIIIYDRLANPDILNEAKDGSSFLYVGKESGNHIMPQKQINETIYQHALKHDVVVRLKGGDPFVFGRGGEEAAYLKSRGVDFEVVPGVTSAVSVPTYAGIPVTHRGVAVSFRVVTGHESPDKPNSQIDWQCFSSDETLIFLMGLHNMEQISRKLIEIGKPEEYPCAVISKGTTKEQQVVVGTLSNIVSKTKELPTPALIIVGKVVELREQLQWFKK
ncbi:MAG: uroporphyrinogen-III C-methyltransferase [Campylobacterota bacterium]